MKLRRLVAVLAVGAFLLTGAACSSDSKDDKTDNGDSSAQADGTDSRGDSGDSLDDATPVTVTDEEFSTQISALRAEIKAAGTDVCDLMEAAQANPPQPANESQTKEFVGVYTDLLRSIGAALGGDDQKVLDEAADGFEKLVAEKGYSPDVFDDEEISNFLSDEGLTDAMERFSEQAMACLGDDFGETDDIDVDG